jgi:DNA topoisomerase-1
LIDKLALRVGNEKGDDEADTVGCCSLRVEHIKFPSENVITLEFLAKDSMPYSNTVEVDPIAYKNLYKFAKEKKPDDDLFDRINVSE